MQSLHWFASPSEEDYTGLAAGEVRATDAHTGEGKLMHREKMKRVATERVFKMEQLKLCYEVMNELFD